MTAGGHLSADDRPDGAGVVGHAGARLLADLADATGLTTAYSTALRPLRPRGTGHDPGRIATDLAVMLADGGETITELAVLRDQSEVFGPVASTPTAWTRVFPLDGELAAAEPKKPRYRILHVAARITRGGRRLRLRTSATWPWRHELAAAFHRPAALPRPAG